MGSGRRGGKHSSQEDGEDSGYSRVKIVQGNPIIINGEDYLLRISETRMEAFLILYRRFSEKEIRGLLQENGIVYGIKEKALEELARGEQKYEEVFVAQGTAKKDGRDGYFEYHFNPNPETMPIILPDGSVDYNVLGKMELVTKGQLLVTYHAVLPAVAGRDVQGNIMEAYEGKDLPPLQCKRCELDEKGVQYYASTEGNVTLEGRCLTVTPIYAIDGNLDAATGMWIFTGMCLCRAMCLRCDAENNRVDHRKRACGDGASLRGKRCDFEKWDAGFGNGVIRAGRNVMARFWSRRRFTLEMR